MNGHGTFVDRWSPFPSPRLCQYTKFQNMGRRKSIHTCTNTTSSFTVILKRCGVDWGIVYCIVFRGNGSCMFRHWQKWWESFAQPNHSDTSTACMSSKDNFHARWRSSAHYIVSDTTAMNQFIWSQIYILLTK